MSAKKKLEEKHLQSLKALQQLECNKRCFECDQRGPTYVDVTIGSFVCTSCGGVLRGLNPPHRVKSVSMATFTPAEISMMETRGNEFCRNIYLGKYDSKSKPRPDSKDHAKLKFFMEQKYEQKRWYVPPEQAQKPAAVAKQPETNTAKPVATKPLTTLIGNNAPKLRVDKPINQAVPTNNFLADFSSAPAPAPTASHSTGDGFADFSSAFSSSFDGFGDFTSGTTNNVATSGGFANFFTPLNPIGTSTESAQPAASSSKVVDKYADLGDLFSSEAVDSSSVGAWSSGTSTASTSVFAQSGPSQPSVFGASQQQTSVFGSNQPVFGTSPQQPPSVFGTQQTSVFGNNSQTTMNKPQNQSTAAFGIQQQPTNMFRNTTQLSSSPFSYTQPNSTAQQGTFAYGQQPPSQAASGFGFAQQPANAGASFTSSPFGAAPAAFGNQSVGFNAQQPFMSTAPATMANPFMQANQPLTAAPASNLSNPFMMQQSSQGGQPNLTNPFMSASNPTQTNTANPFF